MRNGILVVAALGILVAAVPSRAHCENARIVSAAFPPGQLSYIQTPGVEPGPASASVTEDLKGAFWALGAGQPTELEGDDSGSFPALRESDPGWVRWKLGEPVTFHTTWAADRGIDGCIDDVASEDKCVAVLLTDQDQSRGYFALLATAPVFGNYSFAQPGNAPIVLAAIPRPELLGTSAQPPDGVRASVRVASAASGVYVGSPACGAGLVRGYKVYAQAVPRGAAAPTDRRRTAWSTVEGGAGPEGAALALEQATDVIVHCTGSADVYLATALVFESGFETEHLSESSSPVLCAP